MPTLQTEFNRAKIDASLGRGATDLWLDAEDEYVTEQERGYKNVYSLPGLASGLRGGRLLEDIALGDRVLNEYRDLIAGASADEAVDANAAGPLYDLLQRAVELLRADNGIIEYFFTSGILLLLSKIASSKLDIQAAELNAALEELRKELEIAKSQLRQAEGQMAINAAIACLGLVVKGPVSAMTRIGVGAFQIGLDYYWGASTSDLATKGSQAATVAGTELSIALDLNEASKYQMMTAKEVRVSKGAGNALIVVGFLFDVNEVAAGYLNLAALEKKMKAAKLKHDILISALTKQKTNLENLGKKFRQIRKDQDSKKQKSATAIRVLLVAEMRAAGFDL